MRRVRFHLHGAAPWGGSFSTSDIGEMRSAVEANYELVRVAFIPMQADRVSPRWWEIPGHPGNHLVRRHDDRDSHPMIGLIVLAILAAITFGFPHLPCMVRSDRAWAEYESNRRQRQ